MQLINIKKQIEINNQKIAYLDNEISSELVLVFVHGNSSNSESFMHQFNDTKLKTYRMIAIDLPGHGNSDWLTHYTIPSLSRTIADFIKVLGLNQTLLVAHSLGGHLVIQTLKQIKNCKGLYLFGTPPLKLPLNFDDAFLPNPAMPLFFKSELSKTEIKQFASSLTTEKHITMLTESIVNTDDSIRGKLMESIQNGELKDEVKILNSINIPVAIILGSHDSLINAAYLENLEIHNLWKNKCHFIKNAQHNPQLEQPELFSELLSLFAKEVCI